MDSVKYRSPREAIRNAQSVLITINLTEMAWQQQLTTLRREMYGRNRYIQSRVPVSSINTTHLDISCR